MGDDLNRKVFLDGKVTLWHGDCREVLKDFADNSIDSVVCDPPYALVSINRRFSAENAAKVKIPAGGTGAYARASSGFMGQKWDTGETAFAVGFWQEVFRVLKPGGHVLAFAATKTYHRLACAIEDAGFEIRDQIGWVYGCGFPKSLNISKYIDKKARLFPARAGGKVNSEFRIFPYKHKNADKVDPIHVDAKKWHGWGTALKPAWEPICVARKPIETSNADNVLKYGVGALNIDGCRVVDGSRWPANIIHDGSDEVAATFPGLNDKSAARFFYSAKASKAERLGSKHPTVKPVDLMAYLCRLVTPPGGVVLDPFAGTGTTGEAAAREGFSSILIEREEEYLADIAKRMALAKCGKVERRSAVNKASNTSIGGLFAEAE